MKPRATYIRIDLALDVTAGVVVDVLFVEAPSFALLPGPRIVSPSAPLVADDGSEHVERATGIVRARLGAAVDGRPGGALRSAAVSIGAALYLDGEARRASLRRGISQALAALAIEGGGR